LAARHRIPHASLRSKHIRRPRAQPLRTRRGVWGEAAGQHARAAQYRDRHGLEILEQWNSSNWLVRLHLNLLREIMWHYADSMEGIATALTRSRTPALNHRRQSVIVREGIDPLLTSWNILKSHHCSPPYHKRSLNPCPAPRVCTCTLAGALRGARGAAAHARFQGAPSRRLGTWGCRGRGPLLPEGGTQDRSPPRCGAARRAAQRAPHLPAPVWPAARHITRKARCQHGCICRAVTSRYAARCNPGGRRDCAAGAARQGGLEGVRAKTERRPASGSKSSS